MRNDVRYRVWEDCEDCSQSFEEFAADGKRISDVKVYKVIEFVFEVAYYNAANEFERHLDSRTVVMMIEKGHYEELQQYGILELAADLLLPYETANKWVVTYHDIKFFKVLAE